MTADAKTCADCRVLKPLSDFHKSAAGWLGRHPACSDCVKARRLRWAAEIPPEQHGYATYTCGCRCRRCRAAKAAYMRERRAAATQIARPGIAVTAKGVTHGTRSAFEEHGCRCQPCMRAEFTSSRNNTGTLPGSWVLASVNTERGLAS
jgi:hypothetical protein